MAAVTAPRPLAAGIGASAGIGAASSSTVLRISQEGSRR